MAVAPRHGEPIFTYLCKHDRNEAWGEDDRKMIVVCIVSDGRQKMNSRTSIYKRSLLQHRD